MKESDIQRLIMLSASDAGCMILRNNCGVLKNPAGIPVRFGVGNPGGSDLIGVTPVLITPEMVGQTIGVFTAIEVKTCKGRATPDQLRFIDAVKAKGGIAGIARSPEDALALLSLY
jgi:hypothetical protein